MKVIYRHRGARQLRMLGVLTSVLGACACAVLSGCGGGAASKAKPAIMVGVLPSDVGDLNPALNNSQFMDSIAYESLTHVTQSGKIEPGLAASWRYVGSGNKVFEVTLRKDARFSDGTPVTPADVARWLTYFAEAPGNAHGSSLAVASTKVVGPHTLRITSKASNPAMAATLGESVLAGAVPSAAAVKDPTKLSAATYGAGQYMLVPSQTITNQQYTYVPNPYYYDKSAVKFSKVTLKVIPTPTAMLQALQAGQIEVAHGDFTTANAAGKAGFTVNARRAQTSEIFGLDWTGGLVKPLGSVPVRQALNYAIDRKSITKALFGSYGTPTSQILTANGNDPKSQNYYPYDPTKAKALLKAAGYPNGFTMRVAVLGAAAGNGYLPMVQAVATNLKAIGVKLDITTTATAAAFNAALASKQYAGVGVTGGAGETWLFGSVAFANPSVYNQHGWEDAKMTALLKEASTAKNPEPVYTKIMGRATELALAIPVAQISTFWFSKKNIGGVSAAAGAQGLAHFPEWYVK